MSNILEIPGGYTFDLLEDGDFIAYSVEVLTLDTICFHGIYRPLEGDEKKASLRVIVEKEITPDMTIGDILHLGWEEAEVE